MSYKNEEMSLFERYSDLMDQKIKGVQIACYSVAFIGLTYALRRVRPFSRFKKPSDIPKHFIREHRELTGTVQRVEPNGILLINHKPLISLPGIRQGELPIKIANLEINGHGISWLQVLVAGNEVKFIPISKREKYVECQVQLSQKTHDKKEKTINLGVSLLLVGFGNLQEIPIDKKDKNYKYYTELLVARESALKKEMGLKYYVKPTKLIIAAILYQLSSATNWLVKKISNKINTPKAITAPVSYL